MDMKKALDALIAYALCGINEEKTDLHCSDCPRYKPTDDEENFNNCESWTDEEVGEAIRLLKDVKVADPNPNLSGKWVLAKMLSVPVAHLGTVPKADVRATEMDSVPLYEEPLKGRKQMNNITNGTVLIDVTPEDVMPLSQVQFANLPTAEEYRQRMQAAAIPLKRWSDPVFKCPKCDGGAMCRDNTVVLTSNPPKHVYQCNNCGYVEYL